MIGVGVIGVGTMGRRHAENLAWLVPGARLVGVSDVDEVRAQSVASHCASLSGHEVATYVHEEELCARTDLDAVVIAGPAGLHAGQIVRAAAAGKHVFCEKPPALSLDDASTAIASARQAGVSLQIGFMRHYDPPYVAAKRHIDSGAIGKPVLYKAMARDPKVPPASFIRSSVSAGLFVESAIHDYDAGCWLMGSPVDRVSAFGVALISEELGLAGDFDTAVTNLQFASGALGNHEGYWNAMYGYDIRAEVIGERGTVQIGRIDQTACTLLTESGALKDVYQDFLTRFQEAYVLELRDFVARLIRGESPAVTGEDGLHALAIALAAGQSASEGGAVTRVAGH